MRNYATRLHISIHSACGVAKRFLTTFAMETYKKNWFKYVIGFGICFLIRIIPFRPPNIEPILVTQMPFSKSYGGTAGFLFAFFSIVIFDALAGEIGVWTWVTAGMYGFLGIWASYYFKNKNNTSLEYATFAVMGTIAFDVVTGLSIGPLFFQQPFVEAFVGQIPFTALHLLGNVSFAFFVSPLIYRFVIENRKLETSSLLSFLNIQNA